MVKRSNRRKLIFLTMAITIIGIANARAEETSLAAESINSLGINLLIRSTTSGDNAIISPYSIQSAMALAYAGASGITHDEMSDVLTLPKNEVALRKSLHALQKEFTVASEHSQLQSERNKELGGETEPFILNNANRLFGQLGYRFNQAFLHKVQGDYSAPFIKMDFRLSADSSRRTINSWVEEQTSSKIKDLLPPNSVDEQTRLILVNALYFKAAWEHSFRPESTKDELFYSAQGISKPVPTMSQTHELGYLHHDGVTIVTVPYLGGDLQLVVFLPDAKNGLSNFETQLTPKLLSEAAKIPRVKINIHLPKFRVEPPLLRLGSTLRKLGMKSAFDEPQGSANFGGMAERMPDDYLFISEVFHKTFIEIEEKGTEAAAATAISMLAGARYDPSIPPEVHIDHPFIFAIQHRNSAACIFVGRLTNPD